MTRAAGRVTSRTGPNAAGVIARLKANLIARYKLASVPGRPEELRLPGTDRAVSVQYGCQMVRVRLMEGRKWVEVFDLQIATDERENRLRCFRVLDAWFEVIEGKPGELHDVSTYGGPLARGGVVHIHPPSKPDLTEIIRVAVRRTGGRSL